MSRTLVEVQQEFARFCAQAGQIQYQIAEATKDLNLVNSRLRDLNLEASKIKEKESIEKEAAEKALKEAQVAGKAE